MRLGSVGVQPQQVAREVADRLAHACAGALPLPATQLGELWMVASGVARDALDLLDRHPDPATLGEVELQEVALL